MAGPFSGAPTRTDWLLLCEMADAQIFGRDAEAAALCGAAGPVTPYFLPGAGAVPSVLLVALPSLVIISVTGTIDAQQMTLNVLARGLNAIPGVPGRAHQYWGTLGQSIARSVRDTLSAVEGGRRVVCIGHSLGGAVAQVLAALLLAARYPDVGCYTAGAPRVGDPAFAAFIAPITWRLEDAGDPVLSLPPIPTDLPGWVPSFAWPRPVDLYTHAGEGQTLGLAGDLTAGSTPLTSVEAVAELLQNGATAHRPNQYVRRLAAAWGPDSRIPGAGGYPDPGALAVPLDRAGIYYPRDVSRDPPPISTNTTKGANMPGFYNSKFRFMDTNGEVFGEHVYYPGVSTMTAAYALATPYITARVQMFARGVRLIKHTISSDEVFRDYWSGFKPTLLKDSTGEPYYNVNFQASDFAWTTLQVDMTDNDGLYHGRIFLSGLPQTLTARNFDATGAINADANFGDAWRAFQKLVQPVRGSASASQYAFKALSKDNIVAPRMRVTGANWAAGVQTVTTGPLTPGGDTVSYVPGMMVRISRTRGVGVQINGVWPVNTGGAGTFTFNQPIAPGFTWVRGGTAHPQVPALIIPSFLDPVRFTSRQRANFAAERKGRRVRRGDFQYPATRPPAF